MSMGRKISFSDCTLNLDEAILKRGEVVVAVEPQVFDLIRYFAENAGHLVTRDDIIDGVWGGRIVSDAAISTRINAVRKALGDDGKAQRVIQTVPRRGFRFLPDVRIDGTATASGKPGGLPGAVAWPKRPSVVVLPFECMSDDAETRNLALGFRVDIQNALVKVSSLFIIAVGSANAVAGRPPREVADTLGVRHVLQGQVRRAGDTARFSVQLVDTGDDRVIWSEQYDRKIEDSFRFLDEVTSAVLTAMNVQLVTGEAARVWHKTLVDLKSLEVFYRGIGNFFQMTRESLQLARRDFENVAAHHPGLAIGPTWVALCHWYDVQRGWAAEPENSHGLARQWAEKAVEQTDSDGQACTVLSHVYLLDRDFDVALAAGAAAVRNRPNCTHANGFYANVLHYCGEQSDALKHIRLAMRHSPVHPPLFKLILAMVLRANGDLDAAEAAVGAVLQVNSEDLAALVLLVALAVERGDCGRAVEHAAKIRRIEPEFSVSAYLEQQPYRSDDIPTGIANALCRAGLPA